MSNIMDIIKRKECKTIDHWSGKYLYEFSFCQAEFYIFNELEQWYRIREKWQPHESLSDYRHNDTIVNPDFILNYMRGLKQALDIIIETEDGLNLSRMWQSHLY